jgi:hypothetical protein
MFSVQLMFAVQLYRKQNSMSVASGERKGPVERVEVVECGRMGRSGSIGRGGRMWPTNCSCIGGAVHVKESLSRTY